MADDVFLILRTYIVHQGLRTTMTNLAVCAEIRKFLVVLVSRGSVGAYLKAHCAEICGDFLHQIRNPRGLLASNRELRGGE